jgi:ABC-type Fe3+-siderophore transport system permease subunit
MGGMVRIIVAIAGAATVFTAVYWLATALEHTRWANWLMTGCFMLVFAACAWQAKRNCEMAADERKRVEFLRKVDAES